MTTGQELLSALARAFVLVESRPPGDPELLDSLRAAEELLGRVGWKVLRPGVDGFLIGGQSVPATEGDDGWFHSSLVRNRIVEVRLQGRPGLEALQDFLSRLQRTGPAPDESGLLRFGDLGEGIQLSFRRGDRSPPGMAGAVEDLFDPVGRSGPVPGTLKPRGSGEDEVAGRPDPLPGEIRELVDRYLAASGSERAALGEAVAAAAARLGEARDHGTVADLVDVLASTSDAEEDPEPLELARRLLSTGVCSQFVARLGSTREADQRERLVGVMSGLGREMALALTDALGEARDRFQRRVFLEAILAQGDLAREMAEKMVGDPRWYVVRNGVALLGELKGEESLSPLTATLSNQDPRVRKEAVQALAKVGGEDASMLLLGMLDDTDDEVRAKACWALGILKVEGALKPLLRLLEKEGSGRVQADALEALGRIGDPSAVPVIEKKAAGRFFFKPSKEIRLAAYKALGAIGTPHARTLLRKAVRDSDVDVRKVALALVE